MGAVPAWIVSQRRDRGLCECCGQRPAVTAWQHQDGPLICWECCDKKRAAGLG
jgi:hypothetical protein